MEQETLVMDKKPGWTYKLVRHKGVIAGGLAAIVLAYVLAILAWPGLQPLLALKLLSALFLLVGCLQAGWLVRSLKQLSVAERWLYTAFLAMTIFLLFTLSALFNVDLPLQVGISAAAAFLLPFVLSELWRLYVHISYANAKPWQATGSSVQYPDIYLTGMPVQFRIFPNGRGLPRLHVHFQASGRMALSEVFVDMLQKQEKKGQTAIAVGNGRPEEGRWVFFTRDAILWKRMLDPSFSLRKNGLKDNAVIYARQLAAGDQFISTNSTTLHHEPTTS